MKVEIAENIIESVVLELIEKKIDTYFITMPEIKDLSFVVAANILNQHPPFYATTIKGKEYQLKKLEQITPLIETRIISEIKQVIKNYQGESRLPNLTNVLNVVVRQNLENIIASDYGGDRTFIKIPQIEALLLNRNKHYYAATHKEYNRNLKIIKQDLVCSSHKIRTTINQALLKSIRGKAITVEIEEVEKKIDAHKAILTLKEKLSSDHLPGFR